jgi:hypothetical protein
MPRKSAAALAVAQVVSPTERKRLVAPAHISDAERSVWLEVVNDQPADAFSPTHIPLLELYCRHVVQARVIADQIANFEPSWLNDDEGLKRYDRLLAMNEREGRAASSLATRLRITRQAIDQQTVARGLTKDSKKRKPWELALEND